MTSVFIVTSGEYSDYSIAAVFATQAEAKTWVGLYTETYSIEEWPLGGERKTPVGMAAYRVAMYRDGKVWRAQADPYYEDEALAAKTTMYGGTPTRYSPNPRYMETYMFARDGHHAVKIANERRIQMIATDQWDEPHKPDPLYDALLAADDPRLTPEMIAQIRAWQADGTPAAVAIAMLEQRLGAIKP